MNGWHEAPLAAFDLETTSADPETARIVTAAIVTRGPGIEPEDYLWLVNPGIEIPAEATAIHGISTERAELEGMDAAKAAEEISRRLATLLRDGLPLIIYNSPFDLTVLDRDTRRHALEPFGDHFPPDATVIDPYVLDKKVDPFRKGSRKLTDVCAHYGVRIDGAHEAAADAIAAARVAWRIAQRYPALASMPLDELHRLQVKAKAEQAASFQDYLRRQGKDEVIDGSWPIKRYVADRVMAGGAP